MNLKDLETLKELRDLIVHPISQRFDDFEQASKQRIDDFRRENALISKGIQEDIQTLENTHAVRIEDHAVQLKKHGQEIGSLQRGYAKVATVFAAGTFVVMAVWQVVWGKIRKQLGWD